MVLQIIAAKLMARVIKISEAQAKLLERQNVDLQVLEYLKAQSSKKQPELQDQYDRDKDRKHPLPDSSMSICFSCPSCGRLFHHKGKVPEYEEMQGQAKAEIILHLIQDHRWPEEKVKKWNEWIGKSSSDDETKEKSGRSDSHINWW